MSNTNTEHTNPITNPEAKTSIQETLDKPITAPNINAVTGASAAASQAPHLTTQEKKTGDSGAPTPLRRLGATALGVVPHVSESVNKAVQDAFAQKRGFWDSLKSIGATALKSLGAYGMNTLIPKAIELLPAILPTLFCAEYASSSEETALLCAGILVCVSANVRIGGIQSTNQTQLLQILANQTPRVHLQGMNITYNELVSQFLTSMLPDWIVDQTANVQGTPFFIVDDTTGFRGTWYCIDGRSDTSMGTEWVAGPLMGAIAGQLATGDLKGVKQLDVTIRPISVGSWVEMMAATGQGLKTNASFARPLTVLLHMMAMYVPVPGAAPGSLAPNQSLQLSEVTAGQFMNQANNTINQYWPWSLANVDAPPPIDAIAINVFDLLMFFKQKDAFAMPVGFEPENWGNSVAVVPFSSVMRTDPATLGIWTLMFMEFPFKVPVFAAQLVDENGVPYPNTVPPVNTGNFAYSCASQTRIIGPKRRVMYVVVDDFARQQTPKPISIGVGAGQLDIPILDYRVGPAPNPVDIVGAIDTVVIPGLQSVNLQRAYQWWCNYYMNPKDIRTSYLATAISMQRVFEPSWYWGDSANPLDALPDRTVGSTGQQAIPGRGNYRHINATDIIRRMATQQNICGISPLTFNQVTEGFPTMTIPSMDTFMSLAVAMGILLPYEMTSPDAGCYESNVSAVVGKLMNTSYITAAFCSNFACQKGVNLNHILPVQPSDISVCSSFFNDEDFGLNHVLRVFTQSDVLLLPYNNVQDRLGTNALAALDRDGVNAGGWSLSVSGIMVPRPIRDCFTNLILDSRFTDLSANWDTMAMNGQTNYMWKLYSNKDGESFANARLKRRNFSKFGLATNFDLNNVVTAFSDITSFQLTIGGGGVSKSLAMQWIDVAQTRTLWNLYDFPGARNFGFNTVKSDVPHIAEIPYLSSEVLVSGLTAFMAVTTEYFNPRVWVKEVQISDAIAVASVSASVPPRSAASFGPTSVGIRGLGFAPSSNS